MPLVVMGEPQTRRSVTEIFPELAGGASARGSTYWGREFQCSREGLLSNQLGWVPVQLSEALDMGLMWHLMLERFYKARAAAQATMLDATVLGAFGCTNAAGYPDAREAFARGLLDPTMYFTAGIEEATAAAFSVPDALQGHSDYDNDAWRGRLERMARSYIASSRFDRWEILAVEREYATSAENPQQGVTYTSRLDLVIRDYEIQHLPVIRNVEHKSATFDDPRSLKAWQHNLQTWGQVWVMANALETHWPGERYAGNLVNITTKGGKVEWSKSTPQTTRVEVAPPWEGLLQWRASLMDKQREQLTLEARGWPKNWALCNRPYGLCPYFDVCLTDVTRGIAEIGRPYEGADYASGAPVGPYFEQRDVKHLPVIS